MRASISESSFAVVTISAPASGACCVKVSAASPVPGASYKVVRGDMLTQIALEAYGDASKFVLIQKANPNLRNGPDRIYFDQVIFIPLSP